MSQNIFSHFRKPVAERRNRGASVARRFAKSYSVALLARKPENYEPYVKEINEAGGNAIGISTDTADAASVKSAFEQINKARGGAPLAAAIFNVGGSFIRKPFLDLTEAEFESGWEANGYVFSYLQASWTIDVACIPISILTWLTKHHSSRGGFLFSQAVIPLLLEALDKTEYPPTLIFTSATAGLRGSANCASFAAGKFALRALYQSLAREFGPKGLHVAHVIIDGVIDIERTKHYKFDHPDAKISADGVSPSKSLEMWMERLIIDLYSINARSPILIGICIRNHERHSPMSWISVHILKSGDKSGFAERKNTRQVLKIPFFNPSMEDCFTCFGYLN